MVGMVNVFWLNIQEDKIKNKYEIDKVPDPYRYCVQNYQYYTSNYYPILPIIPRLHIQNHNNSTNIIANENSHIIYCDLCSYISETEDKLSKHISKEHG
jgi:hypothetical protein